MKKPSQILSRNFGIYIFYTSFEKLIRIDGVAHQIRENIYYFNDDELTFVQPKYRSCISASAASSGVRAAVINSYCIMCTGIYIIITMIIIICERWDYLPWNIKIIRRTVYPRACVYTRRVGETFLAGLIML